MDFGVITHDLARGVDEDGIIAENASSVEGETCEKSGAMLLGELREKREGGRVGGIFG